MHKTVGRQANESCQAARPSRGRRGRRLRPPGLSLTNAFTCIGALGVVVDITTKQAIIEMIQLLVGIWT